MELYAFPPTPRAFKAMVVAEHVGAPYTLKLLDIPKGDLRSPDYAAMNPNMKMPTLKDGDFTLWESNAIGQYLVSLHPECGLMPSEPRARADVLRWQFWDLAHWDPACATYIFEYVAKRVVLGQEPDFTEIEQGAPNFHKFAAVLDSQLKGKRYVTGETLTLADFSVGTPLIYANEAHLPLENYPEIRRWYAALSAMPSWRKTRAICVGEPARAA